MCKGPRHVPHAILPIINAGHQEASLRPLPRNPHRFLVAFVHQGGEATAVHVDNHRQWVTGTGTVEIHEQLCGLTIEVCVPILHILLFYCVPGFGATRGVGRTGNRTAMGQGAQHPKKHLRRHVWTGRSGVVECPLKPAAKLPKKNLGQGRHGTSLTYKFKPGLFEIWFDMFAKLYDIFCNNPQ